jgi:hypothetical protein
MELTMMIRASDDPTEANRCFSFITNPLHTRYEEHHHEMVYPQF